MLQTNDRYRDFLLEQNQSWLLSEANYRSLDQVEEREMTINGWKFRVQFNPERIRSSAAKVDSGSIAARKCFLCTENRPVEQRELPMGHDFLLLVNPYPIFSAHFTLPFLHHTDQRIGASLEALMEFARKMSGYTLFYNGPECGASAPDHLHFQAGENGFMPVEEEFETMKLQSESLLCHSDALKIWAFGNYIRKMISFETDDLKLGISAVEYLIRGFYEIQPEKVEPMMNLLCHFKDEKWILHLFPRKLHRPSQYFEQGDKQLLISPGAVDFGGVFITPRREDFDKITATDILDIFRQVSLDEAGFQYLRQSISKFKIERL